MSNDDDKPPWHATGVKGVVPPGRKLSKDKVKRDTPWQASGVSGIRLPNNDKSSADEPDRWKMKRNAARPSPRSLDSFSARLNAPKQKAAKAKPQTSSIKEGTDLKSFLDEIAEFFREHPPPEESIVHLAEMIGQSHAPYEITMSFTVLSALVGTNTELRNQYAWALERGARAFYNLAMRLNKSVKAPRGLAPQRLDPLFYDLPATAYQIPYAFATDSFLRLLPLLRADIPYNRKMIALGQKLYDEHVDGQGFGDQALSNMFPWEPPDWAPEPLDS